MEGINIENLSKTYRGDKGASFRALDQVNFHWKPGEFISLVGESGCGKSTLARILVGLEKPDKGNIELDGENTCSWSYSKWREKRTRIQAVFQDTTGTLNPVRSVYYNLESAMVHLTRMTASQRKERIQELMELTRLEKHLMKTPVRQLSGGEQRRLSLVRAMSLRPDYFILDEVTSGLDLISSDAVLGVLEQYHREYGCAFLFITHDKNQAYRLSDRILMMQNGHLVREGIKKQSREERINYEEKSDFNHAQRFHGNGVAVRL
ncbi:dipeptide/oligopeptide/nickel ABC transporter ATP-binding protein [Lachnospiraceae bacterium 54-53]